MFGLMPVDIITSSAGNVLPSARMTSLSVISVMDAPVTTFMPDDVTISSSIADAGSSSCLGSSPGAVSRTVTS